MSNLIRTLGLTLPAAIGPADADAALKDSDFPADAKRRKLADQQAQREGQRRLEEIAAKAKEPGYVPPKKDLVDKAIDAAAKNAGERVDALRKAGLVSFSADYDKDTELSRFIHDLQTGTKAADEHVKYIQKLSERAQKVGKFVGLEQVTASAAQIDKIAKGISEGLGKVGKTLDRARKIAKWAGALQDFASASQAMDPGDEASVKAWIGSIKTLWNATAPFLEWVNDKAWLAALEGSEVAGAAGATFAIVGAYVFIGINALEAGVRVESAYFARLHARIQESDDDAKGRVKPPVEAPPAPPAEWKSRAERQQDAIRLDLAELRKALDAPRAAAEKQQRAAEQSARDAAEAEFEAKVFPALYLKGRTQITQKVLAELRRTQGEKPASDWWDCFMPGDGDPPIPEDVIGFYVQPIAANVNLAEARQEIDELLGCRPPPAWLVQLRDSAHKKHLDAALAKLR